MQLKEGALKYCPKCSKPFVCNALSIKQCQCNAITLTKSESEYIAGHYSGCLCVDCIQTLKIEILNTKTEDKN